MIQKLTVAIDAMGGDYAPCAVVDGAIIALAKSPDLRFLFFGNEAELKPLIARDNALFAASEIRHTDQVVGPDDKPSQAVRRLRESSMARAIDAVHDGEAAVVVSGGNTGALMALAKLKLKMMSGIDRPAIVSLLPTLTGRSAMLDLGANIECSADNLVQFAVMGAAFARTTLSLDRPRVGLLNVGVEEMKGNEEVRAAAQCLKSTTPPFEFIGYIEGDAIASGAADVVVSDGFTGNISLKTAEGTARMVAEFVGRALRGSLLTRIGAMLAGGALIRLKKFLDPNNHNGGVFLGLNGLVVKSHGGANAEGVASAIRVAHDMVAADLCALIAADLQHLDSVTGGGAEKAAAR